MAQGSPATSATNYRSWQEALAPYGNAELVLADVMDTDLRALRPPPGKVVSNLPYGVAVPALVRTITELPSIAWVR